VKHLRVAHSADDIERINKANKRSTAVVLSPDMKQGEAACRTALTADDELVDAAFSSECDACRIAVGVAKAGDKSWEGKKAYGVKPVETWKETPMTDAEALIASAMKNRG
jgi:hypothetical protein